jgi:hypothetical protein
MNILQRRQALTAESVFCARPATDDLHRKMHFLLWELDGQKYWGWCWALRKLLQRRTHDT